ncbi:MAG TPA: carbamoyl-phosphate synthase domain-containing protein, partial [Thermomicrobiales bacterium]|nr:carbamoyl-phosphate synthase domain-containing protein [Thermomicrobiales bacterium]
MNEAITTSRSAGRRYQPATNAAVALADGTVFRGRAFGAPVDGAGEIVFTTTMVGYQEVCTDPSFRGQIVCMTYPLIGNYGVNAVDDESRQPWISGLVVREWCALPSHHQSLGTIDDYLRRAGIPAVAGIDTRALTRHIRDAGDMRAVLVTNAADVPDETLVARARRAPLPGERDVV